MLQRVAHAVAVADLVADQVPALFDQLLQSAHGRAFRLEAAQLVAVAAQQFERQLGVGGIILGPARRKGLAIFGERRRIDRKQHQEVVLLQGIDQRSLADLQTHGDGSATKALFQPTRPLRDGLGPVEQDATFPLVTVRRLQADIVFGIGPIDTDEGSKFSVGLSFHDSPPRVLK